MRPGSAVGRDLHRECEAGLSGRVDDHEVRVLAGVEVAEVLLLVQRPRPGEGAEEQQLRRVDRGRRVARLAHVHLEAVVQHPRDEPFVAGPDVGADRDRRARGRGALPRHGAAAEEQLRGRAVRDRRPGLGEPMQLPVGAVHGVGQDAATPEQAVTARARPGQAAPVVGVEVRVHAVPLPHRRDLAVAGPVVLVQVGVEVHPVAAHVRIQIAEAAEGLARHRQAESRHEGDLGQGAERIGCRSAGIPPVPARDLVAGEPDRGVLAGDQRGGAGRTHGLDAATAHDAQTGIQRPREERVLRFGERRAEHECRGRAGRDAPPHELRGHQVGEHRVGQARFGGEDAPLEPLEQLAAAELVGGERLRKVQVRVDEAGQQARAGEHDLLVGEGCRQQRPRPGIGDAARGVDGECAVGLRDERVGRAVERRAARHMEQMAPIDRHRDSSWRSYGQTNAGRSSQASGAAAAPSRVMVPSIRP